MADPRVGSIYCFCGRLLETREIEGASQCWDCRCGQTWIAGTRSPVQPLPRRPESPVEVPVSMDPPRFQLRPLDQRPRAFRGPASADLLANPPLMGAQDIGPGDTVSVLPIARIIADARRERPKHATHFSVLGFDFWPIEHHEDGRATTRVRTRLAYANIQHGATPDEVIATWIAGDDENGAASHWIPLDDEPPPCPHESGCRLCAGR